MGDEEVQALVVEKDSRKNGNPFDSDPITGPRQKENHGHGNNELGLDFTNPGQPFYADGIPNLVIFEGVASPEVTPAPGASDLINDYANGTLPSVFIPTSNVIDISLI